MRGAGQAVGHGGGRLRAHGDGGVDLRGAPITTGTMSDAIAQQGVFIAAEAAKPIIKAEPNPYARRPVAAAPVRNARPMWQRRCTCGHCMTCIGE